MTLIAETPQSNGHATSVVLSKATPHPDFNTLQTSVSPALSQKKLCFAVVQAVHQWVQVRSIPDALDPGQKREISVLSLDAKSHLTTCKAQGV